ncbi:hypothetical protein BDV96DRAFT_643806 [Lophiotrema nucula]|uniref:DUF7730 domain-containing protein n=1 Tax=Lophiotrema nucula TaxID=690887 RepID=A0A6A5ZH86_9PLEO|nr:hypothetical protein BDV96DRAFT_643806 [Lophiotrema nucula]
MTLKRPGPPLIEAAERPLSNPNKLPKTGSWDQQGNLAAPLHEPEAREGTARILQNDLLDASHTPDHLIATFRRNSTQSPLLRLPAELRNKIWEFATSGYQMQIESQDDSEHAKSYRLRVYQRNTISGAPAYHVFSLSAVCRQIYSEVGTLPYSLNEFMLCGTLNSWLRDLLPGQVNAISTIDIDEEAFKKFPGLRTVFVCDGFKAAIACDIEEENLLGFTNRDTGKVVSAWVKQVEGEHVEVIFRDPDPWKES